jgi:hypothetical protein
MAKSVRLAKNSGANGTDHRFLRSVMLVLSVIPTARALDLPAGTPIEIRLNTKLSTQTSKAKDPLEAVVIAPVMADGQFVIPAGAIVRGSVEKCAPSTKPDERATLQLNFTELDIDGSKLKLPAQLASIDNAREKLDEKGSINGILASETLTGRMDAGIGKIAEKYSGFADILGVAKNTVFKSADLDIVYDSGVEMTLKLTAPLTVNAPSGPGAAIRKLKPIRDETALAAMIGREPFQTLAEKPPKPSDITNLVLVGSEEQVRKVFTEAGWHAAAGLNAAAKFETIKALAESRGYSEAPVSVLLLDGKPPDLVFEKLTNTFAQRHHLRVWRRPVTWEGKPVWAVAATHDTGISFSEQNRTFIHKIDSQIDRERAKVTNDLLFTGLVQSVALVDRPQVPQHGENATGDTLDTDAKIAVLVLE